MAYEVPITAYPVCERFQNLLTYDDLSNLPSFSTTDTPNKTNPEVLTESAIMTENETHVKPQYKYKLNNEEIDIPSSS